MKRLAALLLLISGWAYADTLDRTLVHNLQFRLNRGDLNDVVPAQMVTARAVRLERGGEELLHACLTDRVHWEKDPMIFRLLHHQAATSIGCREKSSPSLHVLFYKQPNGDREAWVHFDLYGPGNRPAHAVEVLRNELVGGRTSQYEVYRRLLKAEDSEEVPARDYSYSAHFHEYLESTYFPEPVLGAVAAGIGHAFMAGGGYGRHIEANLVRNTLRESIEFTTSALLQQDEGYVKSGEESTARRMKSALIHSFVVHGRSGDELALPRIAAVVGTTWSMQELHPWRERRSDPLMTASFLASTYIAKSFWHEFQPELKTELVKTRHFFVKPAN